jgi:hypothetical protein
MVMNDSGEPVHMAWIYTECFMAMHGSDELSHMTCHLYRVIYGYAWSWLIGPHDV